jgi:cyclopropane fatty-acyl-phospholipid synthase-like methyltransferase
MFAYLGTALFVVLPTAWIMGLGVHSFFGGTLMGLPYFKSLHYPTTIELAPKGYGVQIFMASLEKPLQLFLGPLVAAIFFNHVADLPLGWTILMAFSYPIFLLCVLVGLVVQSQDYGENGQGSVEEITKAQEKYLQFNSKEFKAKWLGKKIPIETAIEAFQEELIDFKTKDSEDLTVVETMMHRYEIFKFSITRDNIRSIIVDLLCRVWKHDGDADKADVSDVYNRGNDFYGWFLCDKMLYSVGLWDSSDPAIFDGPSYSNDKMNSLMSVAQTKKLDKICNDLCMMKPGMEHLDLGCGWGALIMHATGNYKVKSTGITLSQEQADFIASKDTKKLTDVKVINAWTWLEQKIAEGKKYDVITCLEMSEHIGIRDYQKFCHAVRAVLKDDGIFYLQIAGLRRNWQYEDLVWGLFMNRYVFPGADASCPLYWDVEQLERSGFEVRSVSNEGVHYGLTIYAWYKNWIKNKAAVVKKYGEKSWRNWSIFLSWSYLIAMQGSSTVYMISMTKNFPNDVRSRAPKTDNATKELGMNRAKYWIDKTRESPK